ncbi:MAG: hypothetical protein ABIJ86_15740 [Spirochaetota bacterium]
MEQYRAFGLDISSELPLDLPSAGAKDRTGAEDHPGAPGPGLSVSIVRCGVLPRDDLPLSLGRIRYGRTATGFQVEVPWAGRYLMANRYLMTDGCRITVDALPEASDGMVATYITGFLLQFILDAAGALILHGSAIRHRGRAFLFCGSQGAGKSTLAAALARRGCPVLCDDAIPVLPGPLALPGIPSLKLLPDAYERLVGTPAEEQAPCDGDGKYRAEFGSALEPLPLASLFVLDPGGYDRVVASPLKGMEKIRAILDNTNNFGGLAGVTALFQRATTTLGSVPVYRLGRPATGDSLDEVAAVVLDHIGGTEYV